MCLDKRWTILRVRQWVIYLLFLKEYNPSGQTFGDKRCTESYARTFPNPAISFSYSRQFTLDWRHPHVTRGIVIECLMRTHSTCESHIKYNITTILQKSAYAQLTSTLCVLLPRFVFTWILLIILYTWSHESAYRWHDFLFLFGILFMMHRNWLWCAYDTQWLGLGVWGWCVYYVSQNAYHMHEKNCVLYARQTRAYHIHSKVSFCL